MRREITADMVDMIHEGFKYIYKSPNNQHDDNEYRATIIGKTKNILVMSIKLDHSKYDGIRFGNAVSYIKTAMINSLGLTEHLYEEV